MRKKSTAEGGCVSEALAGGGGGGKKAIKEIFNGMGPKQKEENHPIK